MDAELPFWVDLLKAFGPPVVVGVIAAYVTVKSTLASIRERVADNEEAIEELKEGQKNIEKEVSGIHSVLTELNVKMGLLLKGKIDIQDAGDATNAALSDILQSDD